MPEGPASQRKEPVANEMDTLDERRRESAHGRNSGLANAVGSALSDWTTPSTAPGRPTLGQHPTRCLFRLKNVTAQLVRQLPPASLARVVKLPMAVRAN